MKAAIYCRVSTEDQEKEGTSLDSQLEACLRKAKELGYDVPQELIFKETYSGLSLDRPQLSTLRSKARNREIAAIIVYTPDRLCRVGEDILTLAKEFKLYGVRLAFVKEQWDDTLNGKLIAFILGWASEFEAAQIKERTTRGKGELVKKGMLPQGTGIGLYGYKWDKEQKKRIPLGFETKIVERVFTMIAEGASRFNVAKILNDQGIPTKSGSKWHPLTIGRMVTNPAYIGLTYFGKTCGSRKTSLQPRPKEDWKLLPDVTPPIVSRELFERAQKALQWSKELRPGRPLHDYLLTSHIVCGYCGSPLVGSCLNHRYRYYHCRGARPTASRGRICNAHYIQAEPAEEIVWEKVREVLENPKVILAELQRQAQAQHSQAGEGLSLDKEIVRLRRKIRNYDYQEKRLVRLFRYDEIAEDYVLDEMNQLKKDRQADEEQLARLCETKEQLAKLANAEIKLNEFCARVRENLAQCTIQDKRLALDALDIKVTATPDRIDIKGLVPIEFITIEQTWA